MRWCLLLQAVLCIRAVSGSVLGIDYGTDFVKSSVVAPNAPFEIVLTADSQRKDASGLIIKPDGERIYGSAGSGLVFKFPDASLYAVKPLLGVPFNDLRVGLFEEMNPGLDLVATARNTVAFNVSGTVYPVEEVVAMQLADIRTHATELVKAKTLSKTARVRDVAISIPASFGSSQRQALADAAALADTDLISLVSDSVSVALNYANSPAVATKLGPAKQYIAVYDAGAASASSALISLRQVNDQTVVVEVEGYGSDVELAGRGLTLALREVLFARFAEKNQVERTPRVLNRLWREAERAKHVLSANSEVRVHIESLANDADLDTKITREQFESVVAEQVGRVQLPLKQALGNVSIDDVEAVVLAGGGTRTPFMSEKLAEFVGEQKLSRNVNADEANTQGTSLRGVGLSGIFKSKKKFVVKDRLPHSYRVGIVTGDNEVQMIDVFGDLPKLESETTVDLPRGIKSLTLYEDSSKLVTYELSNTEQALSALYEPGPYSCVSSSRLVAVLAIDNNGIVKLKSVDAACDSVRSETSTASSGADATSTGEGSEQSSAATATGTTNTAGEDATTTTAEQTSTDSSSTVSTASSSAAVRPKTRRLAAKANWEQAPIGVNERADLVNHLRKMNRNDADRQKHSMLHHELESLLYRVRSMSDEVGAEIVDAANSLLAWVEQGAGTVEELAVKLEEAHGLHRRALDAAEQNSEDETSTSESEQATGDKKDTEPVDHDEL